MFTSQLHLSKVFKAQAIAFNLPLYIAVDLVGLAKDIKFFLILNV